MTNGTVAGGGRHGETQLKGRSRQNGILWARAWRERMKPVFDRMDQLGLFADSPRPRGDGPRAWPGRLGDA